MRWQGEFLVAVIELIPRPFTPTVIVDGQAHTDDMLDTGLVEELLSVHCPDLEADIVSAGYRVGNTAAPDVVSLYQQVIRTDPAPANRRTWIVLRADRNAPANRRSAAMKASQDWPGIWWRPRRALPIDWLAMVSTRCVAAASMTTTTPPTSALCGRNGR